MITFDGDRSRKRIWLAEKQVAICKMLGIPAKTTQLDGFTCKGWKLGNLTGGRVTAPMGAVVACSSRLGIKLSVADYWGGSFSGGRDLNIIYYLVETYAKLLKVFHKVSKDAMIADGNRIIKFRPMGALSTYGTVAGVVSGPDLQTVQDYSCRPGLNPYKDGESFWVSMTDQIFLDLNDNGLADRPKYILESNLTFYGSNGSNIGGRVGFDLQIENTLYEPWRFIQQISAHKHVSFFVGWPDIIDGKVVVTRDISLPSGSLSPVDGVIGGLSVSHTLLESILPVGVMPDELRDILLSTYISSGPLGHYCFELDGIRTTLYVIDAAADGNSAYWEGSVTTPLKDYWLANPSQVHWSLFYILRVGNTSYFVNVLQLDAILAALVKTVIAYTAVRNRRMMKQLCMVSPTNHSFTSPYDSYMFHAHDGNIYTWTRGYGAVRFTPTGLQRQSWPLEDPPRVFDFNFTVPPEVLSEVGVSPLITFAGMDNGSPVYLCVCSKANAKITAVYVGSPFSTWTKLPAIPDAIALPGKTLGNVLVNVRPVSAATSKVFLIGVVKQVTADKTVYRFAHLNWTVQDGGVWAIMGELPFTVSISDNFSMSLFGKGVQVQDIINYPSPPVTQPQMPIGPYELYAIGLP